MSDYIDVHGIAIRNRIAVYGRVTPTVEDWNSLLEYIERQDIASSKLTKENEALRTQLAEKEILRLKELEGLRADKVELVELISSLKDHNCPCEYCTEEESDAFVQIEGLLQKHKGN